jgi:hypothetical protein
MAAIWPGAACALAHNSAPLEILQAPQSGRGSTKPTGDGQLHGLGALCAPDQDANAAQGNQAQQVLPAVQAAGRALKELALQAVVPLLLVLAVPAAGNPVPQSASRQAGREHTLGCERFVAPAAPLQARGGSAAPKQGQPCEVIPPAGPCWCSHSAAGGPCADITVSLRAARVPPLVLLLLALQEQGQQ